MSQSEWPWEAQQYPRDDAWNTVECAAAQLGLIEGKPALRNMTSMPEQAESAFALHLGAMWGLRTNAERVEALTERVEVLHAAHVERFTALGFIHADGPKAGKENSSAVKRAVALAYGASGTCDTCKGSGKMRRLVESSCRGEKVKGRFQGCRWSPTAPGCTCPTCADTGKVYKEGNEITCDVCDGTGLDLGTAPSLTRTDGGGVSASRDTLAESGDDELVVYSEDEFGKIRQTYLPYLRKGLHAPLTLRPNAIVATTRTSYEDVIQQFPRSGGVRETVEAREGRWFASIDYAAVELCTLAQVCLWTVGESRMADMINATKDPGTLHTAFAAKMIGVSVEEMKDRLAAKDPVAKNYRQAAKPANFGFPGGMGSAKLVISKRKRSEGTTVGPDGRKYDGIRFCILIGGARVCGEHKITTFKRRDISPTCAACIDVVENQLRPEWFAQWPEMKPYFGWVQRQIELSGEIPCLVPEGFPEMVRGGVDFCSAANNGFQHLNARGAKHALRKVTREAYLDTSSPLYAGVVRVPLFAHDELFCEGESATAHVWAPRVAEIMIAAMREYVPDVHITAEPALMKFWSKDAEPVYDKSGKLTLWTPKEKS